MKLFAVTLGAVACLLLAQAAAAQNCGAPDCCAQCGDSSCQPKVCRVVCDVKKIKKYRWHVECEEFCVPLPGCRLGGCKPACESGCGVPDGCVEGCGAACLPNRLVPPKCGPVRYRKKLVKKEYTIEVPIYRCVVRYLCAGCCEPAAAAEEQPSQAPVENSRQTIRSAPLPPPFVSKAAYLRPRTDRLPAAGGPGNRSVVSVRMRIK